MSSPVHSVSEPSVSDLRQLPLTSWGAPHPQALYFAMQRRIVAWMSELVTGLDIIEARRLLSKDPCHALQGQCRSPSHIPKQRYRVTNWTAYDAALRQRGSLTVCSPRKQSQLGGPSPAQPEAVNPAIRPWPSERHFSIRRFKVKRFRAVLPLRCLMSLAGPCFSSGSA